MPSSKKSSDYGQGDIWRGRERTRAVDGVDEPALDEEQDLHEDGGVRVAGGGTRGEHDQRLQQRGLALGGGHDTWRAQAQAMLHEPHQVPVLWLPCLLALFPAWCNRILGPGIS